MIGSDSCGILVHTFQFGILYYININLTLHVYLFELRSI